MIMIVIVLLFRTFTNERNLPTRTICALATRDLSVSHHVSSQKGSLHGIIIPCSSASAVAVGSIICVANFTGHFPFELALEAVIAIGVGVAVVDFCWHF